MPHKGGKPLLFPLGGAVNGPLVALGRVWLVLVRGVRPQPPLTRGEDRGGNLAGLSVGGHRPCHAATAAAGARRPPRQLLGGGRQALGGRLEAQEGGEPAQGASDQETYWWDEGRI